LFDVKEESTLKQGSFLLIRFGMRLLVTSWSGIFLGEIESSEFNPIAIGTAVGVRGFHFAATWFENRLWEVRTEIEHLYEDFA
jgi:hypothetical protein